MKTRTIEILKKKKLRERLHVLFIRPQSPGITTPFKMNSGFPKYSRHGNPSSIMPPITFISLPATYYSGHNETQASPTPYQPLPETRDRPNMTPRHLT
jgi:hypothetical protein